MALRTTTRVNSHTTRRKRELGGGFRLAGGKEQDREPRCQRARGRQETSS